MATVRYIVEDVETAAAFYLKHFGFTLKQQFGPAMAILTRDDLTLWLAGPMASASRPKRELKSSNPHLIWVSLSRRFARGRIVWL